MMKEILVSSNVNALKGKIMSWHSYLSIILATAFVLFIVWIIFACKNAPLMNDDYPSLYPEEKTFYDAKKTTLEQKF